MQPDDEKEVYFEYCKSCRHGDKEEWEDPCFDCLDVPTNLNSHKPVYYNGKKESEK